MTAGERNVSRVEPEHALSVPTEACDDQMSFEMLRLWVSNDGHYLSLAPHLPRDRRMLGGLVLSLIDAMAGEVEDRTGQPADETRAIILDAMDRKRQNPGAQPGLVVSN